MDVIDTDKFLEMPVTTQALYFHLGMRADDDGFVAAPKKITRIVNCSTDDLKLLASKGYIIPFESGVVVLTHWKKNNYIQSDRYRKTQFIQEREQLCLIDNIYSMDTDCIQDVPIMETQDRLGKDRLGKDRLYNKKSGASSTPPAADDQKDTTVYERIPDNTNDTNGNKERQRFTPPSVSEVRAYCQEKGYKIDADQFIDFYESKGWMIGKNKMKDWKAAVRTWTKRRANNEQPAARNKFNNFNQRQYNYESLERQLLK